MLTLLDMYSHPIQQLINAFTKLPSVGQRTAERFVFHLLRSGKKDVAELTVALKHLIEKVQSCEICWDFADQSPCRICADVKRDASIICVVDQPQAVQVIEKTGEYHGRYHVLRGTLKADDPTSTKWLKLKELLARLSTQKVTEVILALNPDLSGETTMMFLEKHIREAVPELRVTRLARGLPTGSDLQYADDITLGSALKNRTAS